MPAIIDKNPIVFFFYWNWRELLLYIESEISARSDICKWQFNKNRMLKTISKGISPFHFQILSCLIYYYHIKSATKVASWFIVFQMKVSVIMEDALVMLTCPCKLLLKQKISSFMLTFLDSSQQRRHTFRSILWNGDLKSFIFSNSKAFSLECKQRIITFLIVIRDFYASESFN